MVESIVEELRTKHCQPCEGGIPPLMSEEVRQRLDELDGWELSEDGNRIRHEYETENFAAAMAFLMRVAEIAEREQHHPDLHLMGYRHVTIELSTHAIGSLSENDFIVAAKIDAIPDVMKQRQS